MSNFNKLKSTTVYGNFQNSNYTGSPAVAANSTFDGSLNVIGYTNLKNTIIDGSLNVYSNAQIDGNLNIGMGLNVGVNLYSPDIVCSSLGVATNIICGGYSSPIASISYLELSYLDGATSNIQAQINAISSGSGGPVVPTIISSATTLTSADHNKVFVVGGSTTYTINLPSPVGNNGIIFTFIVGNSAAAYPSYISLSNPTTYNFNGFTSSSQQSNSGNLLKMYDKFWCRVIAQGTNWKVIGSSLNDIYTNQLTNNGNTKLIGTLSADGAVTCNSDLTVNGLATFNNTSFLANHDFKPPSSGVINTINWYDFSSNVVSCSIYKSPSSYMTFYINETYLSGWRWGNTSTTLLSLSNTGLLSVSDISCNTIAKLSSNNTFTGLNSFSAETTYTAKIKQFNSLYLPANGSESIYLTPNCAGPAAGNISYCRFFASSTNCYMDYADNFYFRQANAINGSVNLTNQITFSTAGNINAPSMTTQNLTISSSISLPNNSISDSYLTSNIVKLNGNNTFTGSNSFSNAIVVPSASIADSYLTSNIVKLNGNNTFTGSNSFSNALVLPSASISDSALSANVPLKNGDNIMTGNNTFSGTNYFMGTNTFTTQSYADGSTKAATTFYVDNAALKPAPVSLSTSTTLTESQSNKTFALSGISGVFTITLPTATFSNEGVHYTLINTRSTALGNISVTSASNIFVNSTTGTTTYSMPSGVTQTFISISQQWVLTNGGGNDINNQRIVTNAITLPSGSFADAYLTSNVPLKNTSNTYTALNTFNNNLSTGTTSDISSGRHLYMTSGNSVYFTNTNGTIGGTTYLRMFATGTNSFIDFGDNTLQFRPASAADGTLTNKNVVITKDGYFHPYGYGNRQGTSGASINSTYTNLWWTGTALQCWLNTTNAGNFTISDVRIKENFTPASQVLDRLCSIPMCNYEWKDTGIFKKNKRLHLGFFAHNLQDTFPELNGLVEGDRDALTSDGEIQPQTISPELVNVLMKAIQELNEKVEKLSNRIIELESKISA